MATANEATQPLKYNTWVLKVPIHCVGCKRQVKKLLQNIEGVYSTTIDTQLQKVTVSGNIELEILLKKLMKAGKHPEIWNVKSAEQPKKNEKQNETKSSEKKEQTTNAATKQIPKNAAISDKKPPAKNNAKEVKPEKDKENNPAAAVAAGNAGSSGKAKKSKGQKGNAGCNQGNGAPATTGPVNVNPNRCQGPQLVTTSPTFDQFSSIQGHPAVQMMHYSAAYPTKLGHGLAYQVPVPPSISCITSEQIASYQTQATAFNSFDISSDENPSGCSIM